MKISELNGLLKPEKEDYIPIVDNSEKETKKASISALLDLFYPVGSYYETSNAHFNPNESWGGTWNLDNDGTVLASQNLETGSLFNKDLGTVVGEEKHLLTIEEMPNHNHSTLYWDATKIGLTTVQKGTGYPRCLGVDDAVISGTNPRTNYTGDNVAHNNVQPSKIVNRWHREA